MNDGAHGCELDALTCYVHTGGAHGAFVYLFALMNLLLAPNLLDIYVCTWWRYLLNVEYIVGYIFKLMEISMHACLI